MYSYDIIVVYFKFVLELIPCHDERKNRLLSIHDTINSSFTYTEEMFYKIIHIFIVYKSRNELLCTKIMTRNLTEVSESYGNQPFITLGIIHLNIILRSKKP